MSKRVQRNDSIPIDILVYAMPCVAIGVFMGMYIMLYDNSPKTYLTIFAFVIVSYLVIANIHEFGHYLSGVSYGYRLISYRVGPFMWCFEKGKVKFSFALNKGYGVSCAMISPKKYHSMKENILYFTSGIIFNVLSGLIFIILSDFFPSDLLLFILGILSVLIGILNLIPMMSGNSPTDGKIIWSYLLGSPLAEQWMELNEISIQLAAGTRPRELPELVKCKDISSVEFNVAAVLLLSYLQALDRGNVKKTRKLCSLMEEKLEQIPVYSLKEVYYEICFLSCITGEEQKAREYYEKAGKKLKKDMSLSGLRVKAYYEYYVNKNNAASGLNCQKALDVADKFPIKGQAALERDLVAQLQSIL